jgi:mannosyltransferase OCH1-like enzyme
MRRGLLVFLIVNLLIITFLVRSVSTLLSLLLEDAQADAIHRAELPSPNSSLIEQRPQIIPKIIHQTYKNESIPEVWQEAQKSCIDLHPDYEYMVFFLLSRGLEEYFALTSFPAMDKREIPRIHCS